MSFVGTVLRHFFGAILFDLPRFFLTVVPGANHRWINMRNRHEQLLYSPCGSGAKCKWQWTSDLHVAKIFPWTGRLLMQKALSIYPIVLSETHEVPVANPDITFIIGHRGMSRLSLLLQTIASIAGQKFVKLECIVVEQSVAPEVKSLLPPWVKYIHTPLPDPNMPYNRSWALNVGARHARGRVLVLHDNDMLVPESYSAEILNRVNGGAEVVNLKRFIFYLSESHSLRVISSKKVLTDTPPETVVQNLEAGGSLAVSREAYFEIGGYDESFVGWGGEDNEFWDRAQTRKVWPYTYLPVVHLWHEAQPEKHSAQSTQVSLYQKRSLIPVSKRIEELTKKPFGERKAHLRHGDV